MTKISRNPMTPDVSKRVERNFWKAVSRLKSSREAEMFFKDLLTHTERKMLAKRLQIACMLLEGASYGVIKKNLKVTSTTIAKVNNWLNTFGQGYRLVIERIRI